MDADNWIETEMKNTDLRIKETNLEIERTRKEIANLDSTIHGIEKSIDKFMQSRLNDQDVLDRITARKQQIAERLEVQLPPW